jgi:hypothetical protein
MTKATPTADEISAMTLPKLRSIAGELFDADDIKGLRKAQLIEMITEYYDEVDDEDEEEDDNPIVDSEPDDDEEDDELDDDEVPEPVATKKVNTAPKGTKPTKGDPVDKIEPNGETYTAKQIATRIGTDAKTLRKFFRSASSTVEACGQGGRYEFAKSDLPQIKAEFEKYQSTARTRTPKAASDKPAAGRRREVPATAIVEDDEELDLDDMEPDDEELEIDDELDDDELDG